MTMPESSSTASASTDASLTDREDSLLASLLEQLTLAMRRGEQPDLDCLAARYPELAGDLRSLWATVWIAEEMGAKNRASPK